MGACRANSRLLYGFRSFVAAVRVSAPIACTELRLAERKGRTGWSGRRRTPACVRVDFVFLHAQRLIGSMSVVSAAAWERPEDISADTAAADHTTTTW